jgi:hypothetical protein
MRSDFEAVLASGKLVGLASAEGRVSCRSTAANRTINRRPTGSVAARPPARGMSLKVVRAAGAQPLSRFAGTFVLDYGTYCCGGGSLGLWLRRRDVLLT